MQGGMIKVDLSTATILKVTLPFYPFMLLKTCFNYVITYTVEVEVFEVFSSDRVTLIY